MKQLMWLISGIADNGEPIPQLVFRLAVESTTPTQAMEASRELAACWCVGKMRIELVEE